MHGRLASAREISSRESPSEQVESRFVYFDDPVEEFRAHMRMERDLVDAQGTTLTWYHWIVFIIPGGRRPEPFVRYEGIEYSYFRHLGDNNYRIHAHNLSFPRDLETNRFTDSAINPITNERVEVPVSIILNDPGTIGGPAGFRNLSGDGSAQDVFRQFRIESDLIKLDSVRSAPPDWPATHIENSCQWVELELYNRESITSLPVRFCGHYAYEYPDWLRMPDRKGHLTGFWDGRKVDAVTELPAEMLDRMEKEYPELLEPRWAEFEKPIPFEL
ncbi:MAG: DUF1838 domain-containing protein [Gammaproteobacteria bacterium]|nr:DUF1838 domain-containing protein [Gammaproteobacteria bacterium]